MKSLASSEMSVNSSSSKFHWQAKMLFSVSLSSSPRNGDKPLSLDPEETQVRDATVCLFKLRVCVCVNDHAQLTTCKWWRQGSTCLWGMKRTHSWWLPELKIQVFQSWPSASPWVYTCQRHTSRNIRNIYQTEKVLKWKLSTVNIW